MVMPDVLCAKGRRSEVVVELDPQLPPAWRRWDAFEVGVFEQADEFRGDVGLDRAGPTRGRGFQSRWRRRSR